MEIAIRDPSDNDDDVIHRKGQHQRNIITPTHPTITSPSLKEKVPSVKRIPSDGRTPYQAPIPCSINLILHYRQNTLHPGNRAADFPGTENARYIHIQNTYLSVVLSRMTRQNSPVYNALQTRDTFHAMRHLLTHKPSLIRRKISTGDP